MFYPIFTPLSTLPNLGIAQCSDWTAGRSRHVVGPAQAAHLTIADGTRTVRHCYGRAQSRVNGAVQPPGTKVRAGAAAASLSGALACASIRAGRAGLAARNSAIGLASLSVSQGIDAATRLLTRFDPPAGARARSATGRADGKGAERSTRAGLMCSPRG
jgi:hypothetical protein